MFFKVHSCKKKKKSYSDGNNSIVRITFFFLFFMNLAILTILTVTINIDDNKFLYRAPVLLNLCIISEFSERDFDFVNIL